MGDLQERHMSEQIDQQAERYFKKYRTHIEVAEKKSAISKIRSFSPMDVYALGHQLERWEDIVEMCEAEGTVSDLGILPRIALDVITVAFSTSPMSVIGSVQPIDEENGTVYFKTLQATDTRGNMTAGDDIYTGEGGAQKIPSAYAGAESSVSGGTGDGSTVAFAGTLTLLPVLQNRLSISATVGAATVTGSDDGEGYILGQGFTGTINYVSGAYTLTFTTAPDNASSITITYSQNMEGATDIPEIEYIFTSKPVKAKVYALKTSIGMLKSFALKKRFGTVVEEEAATDLVNAINAEVFGAALSKIKTAATGTTTFDKTAPSGVPYSDHKLTIKDKIADAEAVMLSNAGRGMVNFGIVGYEFAAVISTLPGFVKLYDGSSTSGAHLYGTLDGMPIIRVPLTAQLGSKLGIWGYKGASTFEAALSYNPYMPLTVTSVLPHGVNPLNNQRAAAIWAATEVLVPNFLTNLNMIISS